MKEENNAPTYTCICGWQGNRIDLHWFKAGRCIQEGQCPECHHVLEILDSSD
jgi:hypothetical protein